MGLVLKCLKRIKGTSSLQIILIGIIFHSLASIFILYSYVLRYLCEHETGWKEIERRSFRGGVVWNAREPMNLLSADVTPHDKLLLKGWWMDHAKWKVAVECPNQKWGLCTKVFSCDCKPDKVRAIYQYLPFHKNTQNLVGFDLSAVASADQLDIQNARATFGVVVLVKLASGISEMKTIQFSPSLEPLTRKSLSWNAPIGTSIASATVMLVCYGYAGNVRFTDVVLLPHFDHGRDKQLTAPQNNRIVNYCGGGGRSMPHRNLFEEEELKISFKESSHGHRNITLVTQISMDRLSTLERTVDLWDGPVSLAIYVSLKGGEEEDTEWQRIYIQKKLKGHKFAKGSHVIVVFGQTNENDYPINYLRNLAIRLAETKFVFLLDADFQPSPDIQQRFAATLKSVSARGGKVAYVVPAFEYVELPQKRDNAPQTKEELMQLLHREDPFVQPFRILESADSHRVTDYWKWYRADKPYRVHSYSDKYEPYIVVQKSSDLPQFDERFTGYGMNKVSYITELFASGYSFVVLPDSWVIHVPHKTSSFSVEFLQNPNQRLKNRVDRFEFVAELLKKYRLGECQLKKTL